MSGGPDFLTASFRAAAENWRSREVPLRSQGECDNRRSERDTRGPDQPRPLLDGDGLKVDPPLPWVGCEGRARPRPFGERLRGGGLPPSQGVRPADSGWRQVLRNDSRPAARKRRERGFSRLPTLHPLRRGRRRSAASMKKPRRLSPPGLGRPLEGDVVVVVGLSVVPFSVCFCPAGEIDASAMISHPGKRSLPPSWSFHCVVEGCEPEPSIPLQ